jgi:hypothetical protein
MNISGACHSAALLSPGKLPVPASACNIGIIGRHKLVQRLDLALIRRHSAINIIIIFFYYYYKDVTVQHVDESKLNNEL